MCDSISQNFFNDIKQLLLQAGIKKPFELIPICRGGNNRTWMLKTGYDRYFLKQYFTSQYDKRDRFGNEILFSMFAWEQGIRNIAKPLVADRKKSLGLFDFIEGSQPRKKDINKDFLQCAVYFIENLNRNKTKIKSQSLPQASESCLCLADHIDNVKKRVTQLKNINTDHGDNIDRDAKRFIMNVLEPEWQKINSEIEKKIAIQNIDSLKRINKDKRIISPSDFGFHNTIMTKNNGLFFVDFEYAGWDDPIKLICDFFCQPEIPVSLDYFEWFAKKIIDIPAVEPIEKDNFLYLALYLLPAYRLKWCCIMLNAFIPADRDRKKFSSYNNDRRKIQLSKAVHYLTTSWRL